MRLLEHDCATETAFYWVYYSHMFSLDIPEKAEAFGRNVKLQLTSVLSHHMHDSYNGNGRNRNLVTVVPHI